MIHIAQYLINLVYLFGKQIAFLLRVKVVSREKESCLINQRNACLPPPSKTGMIWLLQCMITFINTTPTVWHERYSRLLNTPTLNCLALEKFFHFCSTYFGIYNHHFKWMLQAGIKPTFFQSQDQCVTPWLITATHAHTDHRTG